MVYAPAFRASKSNRSRVSKGSCSLATSQNNQCDFCTPSHGVGSLSSVMSMASKPELEEQIRESKKVRLEALTTLGFFEEETVRTLQPHDDALVVTLWIGGYDVKRVLID